MDLITGIAIVTAAFMLGVGIIAHAITEIPHVEGAADPGFLDHIRQGRARAIFATLLTGFFVGLTDVLIAAGLLTIAAINVLVGAGAIGILLSQRRSARR